MTAPETSAKPTEEMRDKLSHFLPDALKTALKSYRNFYGQTGGFEDAKEFSAHHTACKAAIAHIELLIKLAKWAELPDPSKAQAEREEKEQAELMLMLADAQAELSRYVDE